MDGIKVVGYCGARRFNVPCPERNVCMIIRWDAVGAWVDFRKTSLKEVKKWLLEEGTGVGEEVSEEEGEGFQVYTGEG